MWKENWSFSVATNNYKYFIFVYLILNSSKYKFVSKVQATSSFLALQIILFFIWSIHWNLLLIIRTYFEEWTIQINSRITLVWILSPSLTFIGFFVSWSLPLINPTQPQPNTSDSSEIFGMLLVSGTRINHEHCRDWDLQSCM